MHFDQMTNYSVTDNIKIHKTKRVYLLDDKISKSIDLLQFEKIKKILDIGCADGGFLKFIPEHIEKYGVDLQRNPLLPDSTIFQACDVEQGLPYSDNYFDAIFAGDIIEHLFNTGFFLSECRRVLSPEGQLILSTPNLAYYGNFIKWLFERQYYWLDFDINQNGHIRYFSPHCIFEQLAIHGFKILKIKSAKDPLIRNLIERMAQNKSENFRKIFSLIAMSFSNLIIRLFPTRGGVLIIKAIKE